MHRDKERREMKKGRRSFEEALQSREGLLSLDFQRTHNTPDHATVEHTSVNTPSLSVCSPPGPATCMLALRAGPQRARRRRTDKTTTVGREGIRARTPRDTQKSMPQMYVYLANWGHLQCSMVRAMGLVDAKAVGLVPIHTPLGPR